MMKQILVINLLLFCNYLLVSQTTFAKIIDFMGTPQYADQLVEHEGFYYMAYTQVCINDEGNLLESCGGVIKLDDHATILDSNLIRSFNDCNNCIVIDSNYNKIYFTGEEILDDEIYSQRFMLNEFNSDDFKTVKQSFYKYPIEDQVNYFQTGTKIIKNKILLFGSSKSIIDEDVKSIIFLLDKSKIDTTFLIDFGLSTHLMSSFVEEGYFIGFIYTLNTFPQHNKSIILKLDTNFQEVWRWESEKLGQQLPYGCQLNDGRYIVAMHTPGFSNIGSVWCINEDKSIAWKMEFPEKSGKILRRISRLKQLKDGNIIGCGTYGNLTLTKEIRILEVPFIFKITKDGQFLWEKAFYNTRPILDFANGYFSDVVEMANGDLMAVGRIDDYLEYDPIAMTDRADPDIIVVRTDANGCIDAECATVTKVEKSVSTIGPSIQENLPLTYLFPNPGSNQLELLNHELVEKLQIYSVDGALVKSIDLPSKNIDMRNLKGIYLVTFILKKGTRLKQKLLIH